MSRDDILFLFGIFWAVNLLTWLFLRVWQEKKEKD